MIVTWQEPDRIELGLRAAEAIKCENAGLTRQRMAVLNCRRRPPWCAPTDFGWEIHYGEDGMANKMTWGVPVWMPDA